MLGKNSHRNGLSQLQAMAAEGMMLKWLLLRKKKEAGDGEWLPGLADVMSSNENGKRKKKGEVYFVFFMCFTVHQWLDLCCKDDHVEMPLS
jgi:hypothetical protein